MIRKKELRQHTLNKRNSIPNKEIQEKSLIIQKKLITLTLNKKPKIISSYININNEVITTNANKYFIKQKLILAIPKIENNKMLFYQITNYQTELEINYYSIPQPKKEITKKINNNNIELAIIPAIAFDKKGNRLGYGKGFFDKFLNQNTKIIKIGLAFDCQILKNIPKEKYDVPVNYIITEKQTIEIN